jgi:uncharacterized membrane protein YoaK (UPF0700 family)
LFRHQGPSRSDKHNIALAAYLAGIGGFVNSAGFVLFGTFTSHVTGNVGRLTHELVLRRLPSASGAIAMVLAFFLGAFMAGMILESRVSSRLPNAYGVALSCEAALLALAAWRASGTGPWSTAARDMHALWLCIAMGVQNSLVTRISGAVVRTTHLTGVITDLGIETARWLAWWRGRLLAPYASDAEARERRERREKPLASKIRLHLTIIAMFTVGGMLGVLAALRWSEGALLIAGVAVALGAYSAFSAARQPPTKSERPDASVERPQQR